MCDFQKLNLGTRTHKSTFIQRISTVAVSISLQLILSLTLLLCQFRSETVLHMGLFFHITDNFCLNTICYEF